MQDIYSRHARLQREDLTLLSLQEAEILPAIREDCDLKFNVSRS